MKRREFIKTGIAAMSSLAVGETIRLRPGETAAYSAPKAGRIRRRAGS